MATETSAKFIVALVEGPNDKVGLTKLLEYLVSLKYHDRTVQISVVGTDLLQQTSGNVTQEVKNQVMGFLNSQKLGLENLVEVIEICDVDGVYLSDDLLQIHPGSIRYQNGAILCANKDMIRARNERKRQNIDTLLGRDHLDFLNKNIPFSLFYFSCNFEDVFFGSRNTKLLDKGHYALKLDLEFTTDSTLFFRQHFRKSVFPFSDYQNSWQVLRNETQRIPRWSNLNTWMPEQTAPLIVS
jgi:hypothetical protein